MLFASNKSKYKDVQNFKKSTMDIMKHNSSHFLVFIAGIRSYVMPGHFYRCMARPGLNALEGNTKNIEYTKSCINRLQELAVYEYSSIVYSQKHKNSRKMGIFIGMFSRERRRYKVLSYFLSVSLGNVFPLAAELAFKYYNEFSPDKTFESILIEQINKAEIDRDSCREFFLEIINSVEASPKWLRRMVSLSSELYGENNVYVDVFTIYIAYIIYRLNNCNISDTIKFTYSKSVIEITMNLYRNREAIARYLSSI